MLKNLLRDVEIVSVLDQVEGRFATTGVATDIDERFEIGDLVGVTVLSLEVDGLEELFEGLLETVGRPGLAVLDATGPVTKESGAKWLIYAVEWSWSRWGTLTPLQAFQH